MSDFHLAARTRSVRGKAVRALRRTGVLPAVVYGHGIASRSLAIPAEDFQRVWQKAGESSLVDLLVDGEQPFATIIQHVQRDPRSHRIVHVDFHQVKMTENVHVEIPLRLTGESPAVKQLGGTLVQVRDVVSVECLPADLVKEIAVDISALATFDDALRIRDLVLPKGLTVTNAADDFVAQVEAPRTEAELAELESTVVEDVTQVQTVEKPKNDEETAAAPGSEHASS